LELYAVHIAVAALSDNVCKTKRNLEVSTFLK